MNINWALFGKLWNLMLRKNYVSAGDKTDYCFNQMVVIEDKVTLYTLSQLVQGIDDSYCKYLTSRFTI